MVSISLAEGVRIPADIVDLESFRRWALSDEFPERGWFSYLGGELWVDLSREQLFIHNQAKGEFCATLYRIAEEESLGYFFTDRVRLSNLLADLSTQPEGMFVSREAIRAGRVMCEMPYVEVLGTPDMVLEVVSDRSVKKDTVTLRDLYFRAGVTEYWLVDARGEAPQFDILRRGSRAYTATRKQNGWLRSALFGRAFQLTRQTDPLGHPQFSLGVQS
jgi:Uma2 family endonuclease